VVAEIMQDDGGQAGHLGEHPTHADACGNGLRCGQHGFQLIEVHDEIRQDIGGGVPVVPVPVAFRRGLPEGQIRRCLIGECRVEIMAGSGECRCGGTGHACGERAAQQRTALHGVISIVVLRGTRDLLPGLVS
jgi:hypothetical protein